MADKKKKRVPRPSKTHYLLVVVDPGHGPIDVLYTGYRWAVARTKIDEIISNKKYRRKILRICSTKRGDTRIRDRTIY